MPEGGGQITEWREESIPRGPLSSERPGFPYMAFYVLLWAPHPGAGFCTGNVGDVVMPSRWVSAFSELTQSTGHLATVASVSLYHKHASLTGIRGGEPVCAHYLLVSCSRDPTDFVLRCYIEKWIQVTLFKHKSNPWKSLLILQVKNPEVEGQEERKVLKH